MAITALLALLTLPPVAACGSGEPVMGRAIGGPSIPSVNGIPGGPDRADQEPTADVETPDLPEESTRSFPPGGPVPCEKQYETPLCFPPNEVNLKGLYGELAKRKWDCLREGQKNDAGLEVSDSFECEGSQGKVGKVTLDHSISGAVYRSEKTGPLEEIRVVATAAEIGDGDGVEPTHRDVQKHSVRAMTFLLKRLWAKTHPEWVREGSAVFEKMQSNCRSLTPLDNGESPPTADLSSGYRISCTNPIPINLEGQTSITQSATLESPLDNTAPK